MNAAKDVNKNDSLFIKYKYVNLYFAIFVALSHVLVFCLVLLQINRMVNAAQDRMVNSVNVLTGKLCLGCILACIAWNTIRLIVTKNRILSTVIILIICWLTFALDLFLLPSLYTQ